jgi:acetyl-CoA acetyltransferase
MTDAYIVAAARTVIGHRTGKRYGLQTMCEHGGLANVTIVERL